MRVAFEHVPLPPRLQWVFGNRRPSSVEQALHEAFLYLVNQSQCRTVVDLQNLCDRLQATDDPLQLLLRVYCVGIVTSDVDIGWEHAATTVDDWLNRHAKHQLVPVALGLRVAVNARFGKYDTAASGCEWCANHTEELVQSLSELRRFDTLGHGMNRTDVCVPSVPLQVNTDSVALPPPESVQITETKRVYEERLPQSPQLHVTPAKSQDPTKMSPDSSRIVEVSTERKSWQARCFAYGARALHLGMHWEDAIQELRKAVSVEADPSDIALHTCLIMGPRGVGLQPDELRRQLQKAVPDMEELCSQAPFSSDYRCMLIKGDLFMSLESYSDAAAAFLSASSLARSKRPLSPTRAHAPSWQASALTFSVFRAEVLAFLKNGEYASSLKRIQQWLDVIPQTEEMNSERSRVVFGRACVHSFFLRRFQKAVEDFNAAVALDPYQWKRQCSFRGLCLAKLFQLEQARRDIDACVESEPRRATHVYRRALWHLACGNEFHDKEAWRDLGLSLEMDRQQPLAWFERARLRVRLQETSPAPTVGPLSTSAGSTAEEHKDVFPLPDSTLAPVEAVIAPRIAVASPVASMANVPATVPLNGSQLAPVLQEVDLAPSAMCESLTELHHLISHYGQCWQFRSDLEDWKVTFEIWKAQCPTWSVPAESSATFFFSSSPMPPTLEEIAEQSTHDRVLDFYSRYAPHKLANIDKVLTLYRGKESEMVVSLRHKYSKQIERFKQEHAAALLPVLSTKLPELKLSMAPAPVVPPPPVTEQKRPGSRVLLSSPPPYHSPAMFSSSPPPPLQPLNATRQRLVQFYIERAPHKLPSVDHVLTLYKGQEAQMFEDLQRKYPTLASESPTQFPPGSGTTSSAPSPAFSSAYPSAPLTSSSASLSAPLSSGATLGLPVSQAVPIAHPSNPVPRRAANEYRQMLMDFYIKFAPSKLPSVDHVLSLYRGNEVQMFADLKRKYAKEIFDQAAPIG